MRKLLIAALLLISFGLNAQRDKIYMPGNAVIIYPAGSKTEFNDTAEFKGKIKTPDGVIDASALGANASGISSVVGGTGISVNNTDPNNPVITLTGTPPTTQTWTVVANGDSLSDANVGERLVSFTADDTLKVSCSVAGDSLISFWPVYNYSNGEMVIRAQVCNTLDGGLNKNLTVPSGGLVFIRKIGGNLYIAHGNKN
jgi:hypothetical protein